MQLDANHRPQDSHFAYQWATLLQVEQVLSKPLCNRPGSGQ
jgi:hypothetical protein